MLTYDLAGQKVNRLGYGAMQLPGPGVFGPPSDRERALAVLRRAVELGVRHIDTAQFYGPDVANELIHEALAPYPDDLVVVTKIGGTRDATGNWLPAQRPEELRQAVEANLATLGLAALPVLNLGRADPGAVAGTPQDVDFDEQLAAIIELRDEGKVTSVGLTNVSIRQLDHALRTVEVVCVQNRYNLLDRSDEPMVDRCAAMGIA
ncbi:MAG: aldo/keto reductase, partial [Streptosporangiales bacterium]